MTYAKLLKLLSIFAFCLACFSANAEESPVALDQQRGVEQTFLTFPEWYLVHSPAEYAAFVNRNPAHGFPFMAHVGQLWSSYISVTREQLHAKYPANLGYHVMICVIASSTTVEYALRWAYENTFGRVSWALSSGHLTAEDEYGAKVAQEYVDFIRKEPWYLFDFTAKLKGLWSSTPAWGPDLIRKWERRYALTTEYAIKVLYGKVIEFATRQAYTPALMTTQVVVRNPPSTLPRDIKLVRQLDGNTAIMDLPRYFDFRVAATELAQAGGQLVDIAGNRSVILVSVWASNDNAMNVKNARILFEQPLITRPGYKRVALILPVPELSDFLLSAPQQNLRVEHVYDY